MKECNIPDPVRFRAQCTGVGATREASELTGHARSIRVAAKMPAAQRPHAIGYPEVPDYMTDAHTYATTPFKRGSLRR